MAVTLPADPLLHSPSGARGAAASAPARAWEEARSDEALVLAIRAGERAAEEELYRRHAGAVLGLAARLLHSRDEALDVMQDAFVTAFEQLGTLREPAAFGGWLLRVTASLVHRRFRRRKFLALLGLGGKHEETALDELADHASSAETRAELRLLERKLATLSDAERAAWLLRHVEGFSLDEVAQACGCSLATAKRRIASADAVVARHTAEGGAR